MLRTFLKQNTEVIGDQTEGTLRDIFSRLKDVLQRILFLKPKMETAYLNSAVTVQQLYDITHMDYFIN